MRAGVAAGAAVGSNIFYSGKGSGNSSVGETAQTNLSVRQYPDGSIRDSKGRFAGKTGTIPGTPGVEKAKKLISDGVDNLRILADFDKTFTKAFID